MTRFLHFTYHERSANSEEYERWGSYGVGGSPIGYIICHEKKDRTLEHPHENHHMTNSYIYENALNGKKMVKLDIAIGTIWPILMEDFSDD